MQHPDARGYASPSRKPPSSYNEDSRYDSRYQAAPRSGDRPIVDLASVGSALPLSGFGSDVYGFDSQSDKLSSGYRRGPASIGPGRSVATQDDTSSLSSFLG